MAASHPVTLILLSVQFRYTCSLMVCCCLVCSTPLWQTLHLSANRLFVFLAERSRDLQMLHGRPGGHHNSSHPRRHPQHRPETKYVYFVGHQVINLAYRNANLRRYRNFMAAWCRRLPGGALYLGWYGFSDDHDLVTPPTERDPRRLAGMWVLIVCIDTACS
jgi:hypothetical protein